MTTLTYFSNGSTVVVMRDQKVITMSSNGYIPRLDVKLPEFEAGLLARLYEIHGTTELRSVNFPQVIFTWLSESNFKLRCWLTKTDLGWKLSGDDGFHVQVPYGEAPLFPHTNLRVPRPIMNGEMMPAPQGFKEYYDKIAFVRVSAIQWKNLALNKTNWAMETFDANQDKLFTWKINSVSMRDVVETFHDIHGEYAVKVKDVHPDILKFLGGHPEWVKVVLDGSYFQVYTNDPVIRGAVRLDTPKKPQLDFSGLLENMKENRILSWLQLHLSTSIKKYELKSVVMNTVYNVRAFDTNGDTVFVVTAKRGDKRPLGPLDPRMLRILWKARGMMASTGIPLHELPFVVREWARRCSSDTHLLRIQHFGTLFQLIGVSDSGRILYDIEQDDLEFEPVYFPLIEDIEKFCSATQYPVSQKLSVLKDLHPDIELVKFGPNGLIETFDIHGFNMFAWTQKEPPFIRDIEEMWITREYRVDERKELRILSNFHYDITFVKFEPRGLIQTFDKNHRPMFRWTQKSAAKQPPSYEELSRLLEKEKIPVFEHPDDFRLSPWINTCPFFMQHKENGIHVFNGNSDTPALVVGPIKRVAPM